MSLRGRRPWQSMVGIVLVCGVDCFATLAKTEWGGVKARRRHCEERSDVLILLLMLSSLSCFYPVDILEGVYT